MVITAIVLISLAVLLGLYLISFVLKKKIPPKGVAIVHGSLAVIGILILIIYALTTTSHHKHWDSIIIFLLAAMGGVYLFYKDIRHLKIPKWVALIHGALGLCGLGWILYHVIGGTH